MMWDQSISYLIARVSPRHKWSIRFNALDLKWIIPFYLISLLLRIDGGIEFVSVPQHAGSNMSILFDLVYFIRLRNAEK